ncbi:MAG: glycosyltransferase family 2 protein [Bacteroidota bacterium]|nr:glycosyltransferase family 2 protein [Bacteroidota bacterium]
MNQSWSIVVFGYNEEKTISPLIEKIYSFLISNNLNESEIIFIDDGSSDGTENIVKDFKRKYEIIKYIRHPKNLGIGPTLLSGYNKADKENVIAIPADGQFNIDELNPFINFSQRSFISFYRQEMKDYTIYRKLITRINKLLNKYFLKLELKDINWVKAYKTRDLKEIDIKLRSSLVGSEICAKLNLKEYVAIEVLSVYHERTAGKARGASIKMISKAVTELIEIIHIVHRFKKNLAKK